jgi:hypothetical protein
MAPTDFGSTAHRVRLRGSGWSGRPASAILPRNHRWRKYRRRSSPNRVVGRRYAERSDTRRTITRDHGRSRRAVV